MLEFICKNSSLRAPAEVTVSIVKDGNGGHTLRIAFSAKAERMISDERLEAVSFAVDSDAPDRIYITPDDRHHGYALVDGKNRHTSSKSLYQRLESPESFCGGHTLLYDHGLKLCYIKADPQQMAMEV